MDTVHDIYRMNANDLAAYIKRKHTLENLQKPNDVQDDLYTAIENEYLPALSFDETLVVVNEKEEEIGEFTGKIRTNNSNNPSITVNLRSTSISKRGKEIGMSVVTTTTSNFHSYEEKWSQRYSNNSETTCKTVLISKKNNTEPILLYTDSNDDGELIDQTKNINSKHFASLLTEGMSYAFVRFLAIIGFEGSIRNKTAVTIGGTLCKSVYKCSLKKKYKIDNTHTREVVIVKRVLQANEPSKNPPVEITTVLTRLGYILKHSWGKTIGEELKIKKSMRITEDGRVYNDTLLDLKTNWEQDIRLKSMYLDKVQETKIKYNNYIKNNREVKDMIISYVKEILIAKPENVLKFSIDYFEKFS